MGVGIYDAYARLIKHLKFSNLGSRIGIFEVVNLFTLSGQKIYKSFNGILIKHECFNDNYYREHKLIT